MGHFRRPPVHALPRKNLRHGRLFTQQGVDDLIAFVEAKQIKPLVDKVYPFAQLVHAHQPLESRQNVEERVVRT